MRSCAAMPIDGRTTVAVIGAGPHGLAAVAHLRAYDLNVRCFGDPLAFWRDHMPVGMILRSRRRSTHIAAPKGQLTIDDYERSSGRRLRAGALRLEEFIDYGIWFQQQVAPDVDRRMVAALAQEGEGFVLSLQDGEQIHADRVVVAAGIAPFGRRPAPFSNLPDDAVSHAVDHADLGVFAGRRLLVVGAGQSALESAALAHEARAEVQLLMRGQSIRWLWVPTPGRPADEPTPGRYSPPTDVGGLGPGWLAAFPDVFRLLPRRWQDDLGIQVIRPAGSGWLRPRLDGVKVTSERTAVAAQRDGDVVRVTLDDGSELTADHVLLGTGYQIDVTRYPFMTSELVSRLALAGGYPILRKGMQSSVAGLHFVGAPAAFSFGPVMRFVVGAHYGAAAAAAGCAERAQHRLRPAFYRPGAPV